MEKNETDNESDAIERWLMNLEKRIFTLEQVVYQLERRKSNGAHPNDGGWND
mgnify:CR=1 FL=1